MKTVDNTIIITELIETSSPDVDHELYYNILGSEKVDAAYEDDGVNLEGNGAYNESYPISIEYLKDVIKVLEEKGCNYMSFDYNCDHPDYTFYGFDVHAATEDEVSEIEKIEKERKLKDYEREIARIEKKKEEINTELKKLRK